jgi:hypothetical protein
VFGTRGKSIEEILKTLDKIVVSPEKLEHWTCAIETTAKTYALTKVVKSNSNITQKINQ